MAEVTEAQLKKAMETIRDGMKGMSPQRAAMLGLTPEQGHNISEAGEFIVHPSNIEELEDKRMHGMRYKEFGTSGKTLHAWPESEEAPLSLVVYNREEEQNAIALGWSPEPVHGPSGKLGVAPVREEPVQTRVREFAAPGQRQPFEEAPEPSQPVAQQKTAAKGKGGRKPKVN